MSRFAELLNTEAFEQKKASLKSRCSFTNRAYMPSVTFLACPKKGDPKKGTRRKFFTPGSVVLGTFRKLADRYFPAPLPRGEREKGRGCLAIEPVERTWPTPPSLPLTRGGAEGFVKAAKGMCKKEHNRSLVFFAYFAA